MALDNALYEFNTQTISTSDYSLTANSTVIQTRTTDAIISIFIDVANMAAGDEFEIALHEKATGTSTQRRVVIHTLVGVQADSLFVSGPFQLGNGWDVSMKRLAGSDRAFSWSVRAIT